MALSDALLIRVVEGASEDGSEPGRNPGEVELARLESLVRTLGEDHDRAVRMLSLMKSVCDTCESQLEDWGQLIGWIKCVRDGLNKPSKSKIEEEQKLADSRSWIILTSGVLAKGLVRSVFDEESVRKLENVFWGDIEEVKKGDGESGAPTRMESSEGLTKMSVIVGKERKEGEPVEVGRGAW
jgi:hypothetical protein